MSGLFLTCCELAYLGLEPQLSQRRQGGLVEDLKDFLPKVKAVLPEGGARIDLVLDQSLYHFSSLELPLVSDRKIPQLLSFELENHFLSPIESLNLSFTSKPNKTLGLTQVAVYALAHEFYQELLALLEAEGFEVRRVLSLENLLAQSIQPQGPGPVARLWLDRGVARLLFLDQRQPLGFLQIPQPEGIGLEGFSHWARQIHSALMAAQLQWPQLELVLEPSAATHLTQGVEGQLLAKTPFEAKPLASAAQPELLAPSLLKQKGVVTLESPKAVFWSELVKNKAKLKRTGTLAAVFLGLWVAWISLGLVQGRASVKELEQQYQNALNQYVPGVPPANGLTALTQKVTQLRGQSGQKGAGEPYGYSKGLAGIAAIGAKAQTLSLSRISVKGRDWTLAGKTQSTQDFELTKEELRLLFPPQSYGMTVSQKAQGEGEVTFSVSLVGKGGR